MSNIPDFDDLPEVKGMPKGKGLSKFYFMCFEITDKM